MTDEETKEVVVAGGLTQDNAILLLAAAEELELDAGVVRTTGKGFVAPEEVVAKAGLDSYDPDAVFNEEIAEAEAAVEEDDEPHDHKMPVPAAAPGINDEGELVEDEPVNEEPAGNASTAEWTAYAKSQGATDEDLEGLKRNDIAAKYGTKE